MVGFLGLYPGGDVAVADAPPQPLTRRAVDRLTGMVDPALFTVAPDDAELEFTRLQLLLFIVQVSCHPLTVVGVNAALQQPRIGLELGGTVARDALTRRRDVAQRPGGIDPVFPIIGKVSHHVQVCLLGLERRHLLLQIGDLPAQCGYLSLALLISGWYTGRCCHLW